MGIPLAPYLRTLSMRLARWTSALDSEACCVSALYHVWLMCLGIVLAISEYLLKTIFEWTSRLLSVPPCGVFPSEESAVVILGGADGVTRDVAMNFSELGYTVFVLSQTNSADSLTDSSGKSTHVSSLLYVWHKRKERSPLATQWGMLAPISLDIQSAAQRAHASETIRTFCVNHALNLVALIVLPTSSPADNNSLVSRPMIAFSLGSEGHAPTMRGGDTPQPSPMETLSVVRDYTDPLINACGRIVIVSWCRHDDYYRPEPLPSGIQQCIAGKADYASGVRTCLVMTSPIDERQHGSRVSSGFVARYFPEPLAVRTTTLCALLQDIVTSRHPRFSYMLGVHPWLYWGWNNAPDVLRLLVSSWKRYLHM